MSAKTPIRGVFSGSTATGLAEFQSGEFVALTHGGLGASLSIGSAGQVLKVNSGGTAVEFGSVETVLNIDGATDGAGITLVPTDKFLVSDNGTEKKINAQDIKFNIADESSTSSSIGITDTLTITSGEGIDTSISQKTLTISGEDASTSNKGVASFSSDDFDVSSGAVTIKSSGITNAQLAGSIANDKLAGSIANSKLANSSITVSDGSNSTATALGGTITFAGTSNEVEVSESSGTITVGLPNDVTIAGNLTVSGTTTTVNTTNTTVSDSLLELNSGASSNANDLGLLMERGSTGDNAIFMFDESADKFVVGTTTATADSTGNISHTKADFEGADIKGSTGTFTSTGIGTVLTVTGSGDDGTEGPALVIKRNSASPADDDKLGALVFKGENDADQAVTYGKISANALDVSDGTEDGQLDFKVITNGTSATVATLDATKLFLNTGTDLTFEGNTADAHELTLTVADGIDADRTITLPNVTGTVITTGDTDTISSSMIADNAINSEHYVDGSIDTAHIADDQVTAAKLANTSVSAGSYGSSTAIPVLTVDAQGRLTAASTASISTDLTVIDDASTSATISLASDSFKISGGTGTTSTISGDTLTINLDNTAVSAASYGSATAVPVITVDAQGRITAASTATTLANVVEDTTPQLGGNLDVQASEITTSTSNGNIKVTPEGTGLLEVKGNDNAGTIQLNCENNSHGVKLKGPPHSAAQSYTLTLPSSITSGHFLKTDGSGNLSFAEVSQETKPTISDVSQTIAPDSATTITIAGTNFVTVPIVDFIKTTGAVTRANTVSFTNSTTLSVNVTLGSGQYHVRVENPDGNSGRSTNNIITASTAPTFSTSAGSLGSVAAGSSVSIDVDASSDSTVAFSETTSVLTSNSNTPAGTMNLSLNTSTGVISGTAPSPTSETTYNFTLRATDAESQTVDRDFSITVTVGINNSGGFN